MERLKNKLNKVVIVPLTLGDMKTLYGTHSSYLNKDYNEVSIGDLSSNYLYKVKEELTSSIDDKQLIIGTDNSGNELGLFIVEVNNGYYLARSVSYEDIISGLIDCEYQLLEKNLNYITNNLSNIFSEIDNQTFNDDEKSIVNINGETKT